MENINFIEEQTVTLKVIQVGIGNMGNAWLEAVRESQEIEFAGFVEINPEIITKQAALHSLDESLIFDSLEKALTNVSADAVIDVTPPAFRKAVAFTAFAHGLPVLCEKPLADNFETAQEIVQKAQETGILYMVAQNYRYGAAVQTLRHVLDSGILGAIGYVTIEFHKGPRFGGFRAEMAQPLIMDMSIHHFDMMRYLLDSDPVSLYGRSWHPAWSWNRMPDTATLSIEFGRGIVVSYTGSWSSTAKTTTWNGNWRFECEKGVLWMQDDEIFMQLRVEPGEDEAPVQKIELLTPEYVSQGYLLHEFYEAVTQGKPVRTTGADNIRSLEMVFQSLKSFETGFPVRFGSQG